MMKTLLPLLLGLSLLTGCASRRLLQLENRVLKEENLALLARLEEQALHAPPMVDYTTDVTLERVHTWLDRAGYRHTWTEDAKHIHLEFVGLSTEFSVNLQLFEEAGVLFMATGEYLKLADAQDTDSVTLLLVQMTTLNYQLLVGKFQLDPESGEVLLSVELLLEDGLGYRTFIRAIEQLLHTADSRFSDLERAAAGTGL